MKIPSAIRRRLRRPAAVVRRLATRITETESSSSAARASYALLYETHALSEGDQGVGDGDYDVMGEIELDVLRAEGLQPSSTLLDFGCGNGRLAIHAVRFLDRGAYIGTDIAPTFLAHAARRLEPLIASGRCSVQLLEQSDETFDVPDQSVDVACAYSVFTHMEHEDMYRYLIQLKRVVKSGGRMVVSCLPLDLDAARNVFLSEAALDPVVRWQRVRNVVTSVELVDEIAHLAGWTVMRWLPGTEGQAMSADGEFRGLGQSIVVLTH